ncbi:hypothetical protein [Salininema proteolyticum]|uniref:Uncharacterized protein n=1 Tax=Salininema proteolyticum TaxID=1607685 RepID=A0ABV8U3M9_9ACTN
MAQRKKILGALAAGAAVGGLLAVRRRLTRPPRAVLYSEPGFRGRQWRRIHDGRAYPVDGTCLPSLGSVRLERADYYDALPYALNDVVIAGSMAVGEGADHLARQVASAARHVLRPRNLLPVYEDEMVTRTWLRLWETDPDRASAEPEDAAWTDILDDSPDLGEWGERARFFQVGILNPLPGFEDMVLPSSPPLER